MFSLSFNVTGMDPPVAPSITREPRHPANDNDILMHNLIPSLYT
jgi:hypothetical protein